MILSFYHMGPGHWTVQVIRLSGECIYWAELSCYPPVSFYNKAKYLQAGMCITSALAVHKTLWGKGLVSGLKASQLRALHWTACEGVWTRRKLEGGTFLSLIHPCSSPQRTRRHQADEKCGCRAGQRCSKQWGQVKKAKRVRSSWQ